MSVQDKEMEIIFAFYAMIVKNLRGVLLFDPRDTSYVKRIDWLRKRFQYRNLGIPPLLARELPGDMFRGRVFRKLYYPVKEVLDLVDAFINTGLPNILSEAVVLASTYISPLMLLSEKFLDIVEKYSIGKICVCKDLGVKDWKLHMRIADYTILDSYEESVNQAMKYLENLSDESVRKDILSDREKFYERDRRRYWRIICEDGENNRVFMYYFDPLLVIENNIDLIKDKLEPRHGFGLGIIPVISLTMI